MSERHYLMDTGMAAVAFAAFVGDVAPVLAAIASLFSIAWFGIQIHESKTWRRLLARILNRWRKS